MRTSYLCIVMALLHLGAPARAEIAFIGEGRIPADALDQSGLKGLLEDGRTPRARVGGLGGALTWIGHGHTYLAVPDRGPGAGETTYQERLYTLDIRLHPQGENRYGVEPRIVATHLLKDGAGHPLTGDARAFDPLNSPDSLRLDAESVRLGGDGRTVYISDEYGPFIGVFDSHTGRRLKNLPLPNKFLIDSPNRDGREENRHNLFGRQSNRGFEGLAITPAGDRLVAMIQDPLLQDCDSRENDKCQGLNNRLLDLDLKTGEVHEYAYPLEDPANGVSELLALNEHEFLVLERDTRSGQETRFKKIFRISLLGASDVHTIQSLARDKATGTGSPAWVPVSKTGFLDLLAFGITDMPEKLEGMTFGPDLEDGRHLLLISSDNDFSSKESTRFFAFAIDPRDLPRYLPRYLPPRPAGSVHAK